MSATTGPALARHAFDRLAPDYDRVTSGTAFQHQRRQAHRALRRWLPAGCRVLEIGCGTGADTVFLAARSISVMACDPSEAMVSLTQAKLAEAGCSQHAEVVACGLEELPALMAHRPPDESFDAVVSNFGALNCAPSLAALGGIARRHLRPGGRIVVGLLGRQCAWETLYFVLTGRREQAARRRRAGPVTVPVAGIDVPTHYHRVADITAALGREFSVTARVGLSVMVPPPYLEARWRPLPAMLRRVVSQADDVASVCPWLNRLGDHVLVCWIRRRDADG